MAHATTKSRLRGADVLLYRGSGWLSEAIRFFDGTDFSHAGLYLGRQAVGEALAKGVVRSPLTKSVAGSKRVLVRRLKQELALEPVLGRAQAYLVEGHRYGYEQILLLAFLVLTRKLPVAHSLRALLRTTLDRAAAVVVGMARAGTQPMICSEFVYRCYSEAVPEAAGFYALEILVLRSAAARGRPGRRGAAARGAGAGLHPESLLEWRLSSVAPKRRSLARRSTVPRRARAADLDRAIRAYLTEVRGLARTRQRAQAVGDSVLASAVDRLALAFASARGEAPRAARRDPEAAVRALLEEVVPDFVTPGDLLHTPSLFSLGDLALP